MSCSLRWRSLRCAPHRPSQTGGSAVQSKTDFPDLKFVDSTLTRVDGNAAVPSFVLRAGSTVRRERDSDHCATLDRGCGQGFQRAIEMSLPRPAPTTKARVETGQRRIGSGVTPAPGNARWSQNTVVTGAPAEILGEDAHSVVLQLLSAFEPGLLTGYRSQRVRSQLVGFDRNNARPRDGCGR